MNIHCVFDRAAATLLGREDITHETAGKPVPAQKTGGAASKRATSQNIRSRLFGAWFSGSVCFWLGGRGVKVVIRGAGGVTILDLGGSLRRGESKDTTREPLQHLI